MKPTPGLALLILALIAAALLAGGAVWAYGQLQGMGVSLDARARLSQMTLQLQVVQNEVAAARQLARQAASGTDGSTAAVAGSRMQFADGVLQGLYSQAAVPPFTAADRQALAALLGLSRPLAGGAALAAASTPQLARLQRALGRYAARLGRQGLAQAGRSARLQATVERNLALFTLGGVALLGLAAGYLAWGWRRQLAALRARVRAVATGAAPALPTGRGWRALAGDLDELERRSTGVRAAALRKLAEAEQAAAELEALAGQLAEACAAAPTNSQPEGAAHLDKLLRGLQGLAAGLQAGSDRVREIQDALEGELPERRHGHAQAEDLAPALQAAGEKVEQLLLLCLNLRLALLHGQAEPAQLAVLGEQLDPLCAEGIDLARDIAQAGLALPAAPPAVDGEPAPPPRAHARPALASLREGLARQAQAAQTMAAFCGRLCPQGGAETQAPAAVARRADELVAEIGGLRQRLLALHKEAAATRSAAAERAR